MARDLKITVSGPPNSFKSTVSFLISRVLRDAKIPHSLEVESGLEVAKLELTINERLDRIRATKPNISILVRTQHRTDPEKVCPLPFSSTVQFK